MINLVRLAVFEHKGRDPGYPKRRFQLKARQEGFADMAFQTPITISKALESIGCRKYVLPAIQREFVWRPNQIERLFDSLMRGYPIGSFLFWIVKRESIEQYKFYDFMLNYHERDNAHCTSGGAVNQDEITAVLDGQQRLTAMNIGLRGSYAYKLPRLWWKSPDAFPTRHLHLNILAEAEENEAGMRYDVRFLTRREAERRDANHCWYRVGEILNAQDAVDLNDFLVDRELANRRGPFRVLAGLHKAVHTEPVIAYYQEEDQDLDKVLDIFIRTNSGGTTLSYSDMLMSMATAQWENLDAREAIHGTIAEINRIGDGFGFSQDFLLKAGLMLAGVGSVRFRGHEFQSQEYEASRGSLGIHHARGPRGRGAGGTVRFLPGQSQRKQRGPAHRVLPISSRHSGRIPISGRVPPGS